METKHTKGEWFTEQSHTFSNRVNIITKKQRKVFTIEHVDSEYVTKEEADANTKLIAAAPELLEACIKAEKHHQGLHSEIGSILREAIKKATE